MKKIRLIKSLSAIILSFMLIALLSCEKENISDLSFEQSKLLAKEHLFVENNRYVLKLSEADAKSLGISKANYLDILKLNDNINQKIAEIETRNGGTKVYIYDYQKKICYSDTLSSFGNKVLKSNTISSGYTILERFISVWGYYNSEHFSFSDVPNSYRSLDLYVWAMDSGEYEIMIDLKCSDNDRTYNLFEVYDNHGIYMCYYYSREWDPFLKGIHLVRKEYDLTTISNKDVDHLFGRVYVNKNPMEDKGGPLNARIVVSSYVK